MDVLVIGCAYLVLGASVLAFVGGAFLIGKPRGTYTASMYLANVLLSLIDVVLVGRIFGWW